MSRRAIALFCLVAAVLAVAILPWPIASAVLREAVARQIRTEYGLRLGVQGGVTLALLPVPRLKFADISLSTDDRSATLTANQLKAELRVVPLLTGRLRIAQLSVAGAKADVRLDAGGARLAKLMADYNARLGSGLGWETRIDRLVVTGSELTIRDETGRTTAEIRALSGLVRWPDPSGEIDLQVSGTWRDEPVAVTLTGLTPRHLSSGKPDEVEVRVASRLARASLSGSLTWQDAPRFEGQMELQSPSLAALTQWTGMGRDLRDFDRTLTLSGLGRFGPDGIEWPRALLDLGGTRLDGALGYRFDTARPQLRATLAGEDIDLGWIVPIADPSRSEPPRFDYDVRLSATALKLGPVQLRDAAAAVLVNSERLEVSLARATVAGGAIRGRLVALLDTDARDIKGHLALDKVDIETLLGSWSAQRGITGTLTSQATFDIAGDRLPEVAQQLKGRVTLAARDGEIAGISLGDGPRRPEARSGSVATTWRGGKTKFGSASVTLDVANGSAEIAEGVVETATTHTALSGSVSLTRGILALRTATRPTGAGSDAPGKPPVLLDIRGPLARPTVAASLDPETVSSTTPPRL